MICFSSSFKGPGLRRMPSGMAIFPMSWRNAARARTARHGSGDGDAKCRNALAMAFGLRVLQVERAAQRLERVVVGLFELRDCFGKPRGFLLHKLFEVSLIVAVFRD